jgi:hypothetical protein
MQNNYVKNKLLFSLSACAILLGLSNSSALAQTRQPTVVEKAQLVKADPDPAFKPILADIQRQLPKGWSMRLPSTLYMTNYQGNQVQIYPRFEKQFGKGVAISLDNQPNCEARACYVGMITMAKEYDEFDQESLSSSIFPADKYEKMIQALEKAYETGKEVDPQLMELRTESEMDVLSREKITLAPGVEGHYIVRNWGGPSTPMSGAVIWEQDGFVYSVRGHASIFEEDKHQSTELIDIARSMASSSLPSKSNTMTWQELKTFVEQKKPPSLEGMIPDQFPNQFANGKIAITRLHPGLVGYVVAKEGVNIPNLSNLKELSETDVSFNSVGLENTVELPAVVGSTDSLYNSSQLIVINNWAPRYDSEGLRSEARKSEQTTLPDGKKAYYLEQGWCSFSDESAEYSDYLCVSIANSPKTSLEVLKSISASNLNTATQVTEIKMPDSLKFTLEQKGGNTETEFVKGDDGYYKWFVKKEGFLASLTNTIFSSLANNTSGTCLGLKENQDLAKVKLTTYRCDSPEGARKWEILMVNDNTGYKIKLPNTKYCLGENIGVLECDSSDAPVENLSPEQYKEFTGRIMPEKKETTLTASNLGCSQNTDKFPNLGNLPWKKRLDYCSSIDAYSGILFDSLTPEKQENGTTKLNMEVFNRGSADALIEIYNSTGNLEDIKIIEGNRPPSDLINSGHDLFTKVPASFFSKYPVDDHRHNLTKQSIEIIIPSGGSVKITKSSNYASLYNVAMTALEISQLKSGDPGFTKSDTVKKLIKGFIKESGNKSAINIFTSEPALQGVFSLDFLDKNKLAEVLYELVKYSSKVEKDPTKNPFLGAFKDVYIDAANIGIENALDRYILPGLGTVARGVRVTGNAVNTYARSLDYSNAMINGDKSTIILEDK